MRTTLDIDDSVLEAVKELARQQGRTIGSVASELLRRALTQPLATGTGRGEATPVAPAATGFRPFPAGESAVPVSNEQVSRLRDGLGN